MQPEEHYRLTIRQGATPGKVFEMAREVMVIGRDLKCDIVINDPEVSRNHTRLTAQPGGYLVEDLESTNGTFVNSQRVTAPKLMHPGDMLGLGENLVLEFGLSDAAAATVMMQAGMSIPSAPSPAEPAYAPAPTPLPDPYGANPPARTPPAASAPAGTAPMVAPPAEKKSNRNMIIAVVVVLLLLCCCCVVVVGGILAWQYSLGHLTGLPGQGGYLLRLLV